MQYLLSQEEYEKLKAHKSSHDDLLKLVDILSLIDSLNSNSIREERFNALMKAVYKDGVNKIHDTLNTFYVV